MLAFVESSYTMRGPLLYNTKKVEENQALFLEAHNFLLEKEELTVRQELEVFQRLMKLNERSEKKAIHLSLNFAESDHLDARQLIRIADEFMRGISFGDQPWLLYQHIDAGHPHVHIVTTNIRPDGSRIPNDLRSPHNLKKLCHRIEEKHHLTPANPISGHLVVDRTQLAGKEDVGEPMAKYGHLPTSKQIGKILGFLIPRFSFTSFEAFNALLSLYRVRADRGRVDSPMYKSGGLYYRMIDQEGKKIGAPIKASKFSEYVTLKYLEQYFAFNQEARRVEQTIGSNKLSYVAAKIRMTLPRSNNAHYSLGRFARDLLYQKIHVVIPALQRRPTRPYKTDRSAGQSMAADDGHGIYYVDFNSNNVIRDTELGPEYTGAAILQRTGVEQELRRLYLEDKLELPKNGRRQTLQPGYPNTAETRALLFRLSRQHDDIVNRQAEMSRQQQQGHDRGYSL